MKPKPTCTHLFLPLLRCLLHLFLPQCSVATPLSTTLLCYYTSFSHNALLLQLFLPQCPVATPPSPTLLCNFNSFSYNALLLHLFLLHCSVATTLSTALLLHLFLLHCSVATLLCYMYVMNPPCCLRQFIFHTYTGELRAPYITFDN
jgi:hypothetical protein